MRRHEADIPVTVIVTTKNEEARIEKCLRALQCFSDVIVVDSGSSDRTVEISQENHARVVPFMWNGSYPKKRQWCLEHVETNNKWVFFVDADEVVTPDLVGEIAGLDWGEDTLFAGYFVKGQYVVKGQTLSAGMVNNKLALVHRDKMEFPFVDDLDIDGMGEMEGHYQPVIKPEYSGAMIGQVTAPLMHYAYDTDEEWEVRHRRYSKWETEMNRRDAWPEDPVRWRQNAKRLFRSVPFRGWVAFLHCYFFKRGFLDGSAGLDFAWKRKRYYDMIG